MQSNGSISPTFITKVKANNIKSYRYSMTKECIICFEEDVDVVILPCQHELCPCCHARIVKLNNKCPFCQAMVQPQLLERQVLPIHNGQRNEYAVIQMRRYDQFVFGMICMFVLTFMFCIILVTMKNPTF